MKNKKNKEYEQYDEIFRNIESMASREATEIDNYLNGAMTNKSINDEYESAKHTLNCISIMLDRKEYDLDGYATDENMVVGTNTIYRMVNIASNVLKRGEDASNEQKIKIILQIKEMFLKISEIAIDLSIENYLNEREYLELYKQGNPQTRKEIIILLLSAATILSMFTSSVSSKKRNMQNQTDNNPSYEYSALFISEEGEETIFTNIIDEETGEIEYHKVTNPTLKLTK